VPLTAAALIFLWLSQVMIVLRERMKPHNEEIVLPRNGLSYLGYAYLLLTMGREQHDKPPEHGMVGRESKCSSLYCLKICLRMDMHV
jgi:hypothetical protein